MDWRGRLWVGYFDRGIDVVDPSQSRRLSHLEDEVIREINFLQPDANGQRMLVATSSGLVIIDQLMRQQRFSEKDGLISNLVSHLIEVPANIVLPRPDERPRPGEALVLTTGRGLSIYAENLFRSLNAFHGLASNHLYTSARVGDKLFVGTLNGLNELEGLRIVRTFQTANSRLSHNWVSALAVVGSTLYIGTYGGGIDALLPSGEMINFASLIGKFSVNPNAMHFDGGRLYVGTLEQGVWVLNVENDTWSHVIEGLGSSNVTAMTSDSRAVYVGTDHGLSRMDFNLFGLRR
jgi:ligand-binding sensor domain-containing protein